MPKNQYQTVIYTAAQFRNPGDALFPIPYRSLRFIAQGDSWFSIGALPPFKTSANGVLGNMTFSAPTSIVNCAIPGKTLEQMVNWSDYPDLVALVADHRYNYHWSAIFLSASGNDLIDFLERSYEDFDVDERILKIKEEWGEEGHVSRYFSEKGWLVFAKGLRDNFSKLIELRDKDGLNREIPIFVHCYDYPTPRNAAADSITKKVGPWLMPSLVNFDIPKADWQALAKYLIDQLYDVWSTFAGHYSEVILIDTRGLLQPAEPNTSGASGDWRNEIHPTFEGYDKLTEKFVEEVEKYFKIRPQ